MNLEESFRTVFKEIFGIDTDMNLDQAAKVFGDGLELPKPRKTVKGKTVYSSADFKKFINWDDVSETELQEKENIKSVNDIKRLVGGIDTILGSKAVNSKDFEKSDSILGSTNVYMGYNILSSKFIAFSNSVQGCEYLFGSKQMDDSSFCIRCQDSKLLNTCYEVNWSSKCSNSMFLHDCFDVRDSMFCFHLASEQYCIANRQYSKEEYEEIKKMVVDHLVKNKFKINFYPKF